jgi:hypothetical protein
MKGWVKYPIPSSAQCCGSENQLIRVFYRTTIRPVSYCTIDHFTVVVTISRSGCWGPATGWFISHSAPGSATLSSFFVVVGVGQRGLAVLGCDSFRPWFQGCLFVFIAIFYERPLSLRMLLILCLTLFISSPLIWFGFCKHLSLASFFKIIVLCTFH